MTAAVLALFGLFVFAGGVWLGVLGGSFYYLIAGVALAATAALVLARRDEALWVFSALLFGTLVWALWEVGLDFWSLAPRGDLLVPAAIWLLILFVAGAFKSRGTGGAAALSLVVVLSFIVMGASLTLDPHDLAGRFALTATGPVPPQAAAGADWTAYGGGGYGDRYSSLTQITPANVGQLKLAWEFRTGDLKAKDDPVEYTNEATPLKIGDLLYTCSPHQIVFAIDAATGALRWKFDPQIKPNPTFQHMTCRGVSYHRTLTGAQTADGGAAPSECPDRIFLPTDDGRMFALDAKTGQPCDGFGDHGQIDLKQGSAVKTPGFYEGTSPPTVTDKVLIVGGAVIDNYSNRVPAGAIRGFDVYSGKLLWAFDPGAADPNKLPATDQNFTAGSPNSWSISSVDEKLGLVYVPLGSSSPDIWAGLRTPDQERYDSALVALDIATGKLRWSFQNVHHDLWDMDMPSQPSLADIDRSGGATPTVYAPAKTGDIFVLDRRDGHLIVPAPELPAPQGAAPGDHVAATQPHSQLSFRPERPLSGKDMWGATMFDQLLCRVQFH